jgi:hypothetical protein
MAWSASGVVLDPHRIMIGRLQCGDSLEGLVPVVHRGRNRLFEAGTIVAVALAFLFHGKPKAPVRDAFIAQCEQQKRKPFIDENYQHHWCVCATNDLIAQGKKLRRGPWATAALSEVRGGCNTQALEERVKEGGLKTEERLDGIVKEACYAKRYSTNLKLKTDQEQKGACDCAIAMVLREGDETSKMPFAYAGGIFDSRFNHRMVERCFTPPRR